MRRLNVVLLALAAALALAILTTAYTGRTPLQLMGVASKVTNTPPARWHGTPGLWDPPAVEHATIERFEVTGLSQYAIEKSLSTSPIANDPDPTAPPNTVAWGEIRFHLRGGTCERPPTVTLQYDLTILLPRWSPAPDGSVTVQLVKEWNALLQVIHTHEAGHASIYRDDMAAIQDHVRTLASCDAVVTYLEDPPTFMKIDDDQAAYHKRLFADCRPEIGCAPPGWMGWEGQGVRR